MFFFVSADGKIEHYIIFVFSENYYVCVASKIIALLIQMP